jgi:hypothetical protein
LLPLNILRLFQIRRMLASIRVARTNEIKALMSSLALERHAQSTVLFRKGDWGDYSLLHRRGRSGFSRDRGLPEAGDITTFPRTREQANVCP